MPNPFRPGVFSVDQQLYGREEQLRVISDAAAQVEAGYQNAPICFLGPPGLGKTALLKHVGTEVLANRDWRCGYSEASSGASSAITDILTDARKIGPDHGAVRTLLSKVRAVNAGVGPVSLGVELTEPDNGGSAYVSLTEFFQRLSDAASSELAGVAFLLDEAQALPSEHLETLLRALNAVEDSLIVLVMGGLPNLMDLMVGRPYTAPHLDTSILNPLGMDSSVHALSDPVQDAGGDIDEDALACLIDFAHGHPLTLQALGKCAWALSTDDTDGPVSIGLSQAEAAVDEVRGQFKVSYYTPTWRHCTRQERAILKAIANEERSTAEADLRRTLDEQGDAALDSLIGNGILSAYDGFVCLVRPGFGEFVIER